MHRTSFDMNSLKKKINDLENEECEETCCGGHHEHSLGHDAMAEQPLPVRRRIFALEQLQSKRSSIIGEYREELLQLQRKYFTKFAPLNEERAKIILGQREPTSEELVGFNSSGVEEVDVAGASKETVSGIPNFWLTVLKNHPNFSRLITLTDEGALAALEDIRVSLFPEKPGFKLEFKFGQNDYFDNTVLTKEYFLAAPEAGEAQDDFVYDHATGCEIKWKQGKNLCFKTVLRTQRHRSNNSTRTVKREEPLASFFHFFIPPTLPEDENEEEDIYELEERLQMDYEIGEILKEEILPLAVDWYTGKALEYGEYEDCDDCDDEEFDEEDDEDDHDDEDDDDEDEVSPPKARARPSARTAQNGGDPNCKQQ